MHILGCAHHNQGSATRDIAHGRAAAIELGERLVDDGCIVLQEPVAEQCVRHTDPQRCAVVGYEAGGLEPG